MIQLPASRRWMRSTVEARGVRYEVLRDNQTVWERFILFKTNGPRRPGGSAFRQAAQEQEQVALRLAP